MRDSAHEGRTTPRRPAEGPHPNPLPRGEGTEQQGISEHPRMGVFALSCAFVPYAMRKKRAMLLPRMSRFASSLSPSIVSMPEAVFGKVDGGCG